MSSLKPPKPYVTVCCISVLRHELSSIEDSISSLGRLGDVQPQMWGRLQNTKVRHVYVHDVWECSIRICFWLPAQSAVCHQRVVEDRPEQLQQQWEDGEMDETRYMATVLQLRAEMVRVVEGGEESVVGAQSWIDLIDEEVDSFTETETEVSEWVGGGAIDSTFISGFEL